MTKVKKVNVTLKESTLYEERGL